MIIFQINHELEQKIIELGQDLGQSVAQLDMDKGWNIFGKLLEDLIIKWSLKL